MEFSLFLKEKGKEKRHKIVITYCEIYRQCIHHIGVSVLISPSASFRATETCRQAGNADEQFAFSIGRGLQWY